jgi:putative endonuclease
VSARALSRTARGKTGERIACDYLWAAGHHVIAANVRVGRDELDLVSFDPRGTLVFTEVRAYSPRAGSYPRGLASLGPAKLARWARAARRFRAERTDLHGRPCRFDAIAVSLTAPCPLSHALGIVPPSHDPALLHGSEP